MPAVVTLELRDVGLAARDLAADDPGGGTRALLAGEAFLVELGVDLGAGARDPTRQKVGARQPRVALPDPLVGGKRNLLLRIRRIEIGRLRRKRRRLLLRWLFGSGVEVNGEGDLVVVEVEVEEVGEVPD